MLTEAIDSTVYEVLLIEDDVPDQMAFMRLVEDERLGYNCTIAGSVSEAQRLLACGHFDVVIADYLLGDGTAFDILEFVRDAPVILATGAGSEELAVRAWRAGACDYLIKDYERHYLKILPITVENAIKHRKTEEKLNLLCHAVMSTRDSVYISDVDDRIIFVNQAFLETYGYTEQEVVGQDCGIVWGENQSAKNGESTYAEMDGNGSQLYHKRKDGSEFPVSLSRSIVKDANGNEIAFVAVVRNISERVFVKSLIGTLLKLKHGNRRMV